MARDLAPDVLVLNLHILLNLHVNNIAGHIPGIKGAFIIYGRGEGGEPEGGQKFRDVFSLGGGGGDFFLSIHFGRGDFFLTHFFLRFFFSQKLHYMYFNCCRSTTAT